MNEAQALMDPNVVGKLVSIDQSKILNAGEGLFAKTPIFKGNFIIIIEQEMLLVDIGEII